MPEVWYLRGGQILAQTQHSKRRSNQRVMVDWWRYDEDQWTLVINCDKSLTEYMRKRKHSGQTIYFDCHH